MSAEHADHVSAWCRTGPHRYDRRHLLLGWWCPAAWVERTDGVWSWGAAGPWAGEGAYACGEAPTMAAAMLAADTVLRAHDHDPP